MPPDDETQQSPETGAPAPGRGPRAWMKWIGIGGASRQTGGRPDPTLSGSGPISLTTLRALPALLDTSNLPNGVVELVIEDFQTSAHQLLDIHDGQLTLVDPGKCLPWASISGPPAAWALALGPERDAAALRLTGDEQLARRLLAALPQPD